MGAFGRAKGSQEIEQVEVEFEVGRRTYRVRKDRAWLLRGETGSTPVPVEQGYATLERELLSEEFLIVNWGIVPLIRVLTEPSANEKRSEFED